MRPAPLSTSGRGTPGCRDASQGEGLTGRIHSPDASGQRRIAGRGVGWTHPFTGRIRAATHRWERSRLDASSLRTHPGSDASLGGGRNSWERRERIDTATVRAFFGFGAQFMCGLPKMTKLKEVTPSRSHKVKQVNLFLKYRIDIGNRYKPVLNTPDGEAM
jgi:hypothetical protein